LLTCTAMVYSPSSGLLTHAVYGPSSVYRSNLRMVAICDRPMLFGFPMVRALMDGCKICSDG
jgi:hypothetical protein